VVKIYTLSKALLPKALFLSRCERFQVDCGQNLHLGYKFPA